MSPSRRHQQLCDEIVEHDYRYYVLDEPAISDRRYDALFQELKELEHDHPELVNVGSPTQRVGERPREGVVKARHEQPMFSLDNTYSEEELREFDRRVQDTLGSAVEYSYVAEPKLDGASLEVVYRDGSFTQGITRGDGKVGEDVTENVRTIRSIPLTIGNQRPLTLRGEVVIYRRDLDTVNARRLAEGDEPFANPRNAAAGSLRLLDSGEAAQRSLRCFFYDLVERHYPSHSAGLEALREMGLPTHGLHQRCDDLDSALRWIEQFDGRRGTLPYETDGVVLKVDRLDLRERLGTTARFPRWAIAFKFAAERAATVVRGIDCDLGRTGALTPVAELEPVQLSGTVVSRASLHNVDYVAEKDVRVGDSVNIEKAGEIIPQVIDVVAERRPAGTQPWVPPSHCPVCSTAVRRAQDEAALRCPNPRCPGRLKAGLFHFTRRGAMNIDHLGKALIEQLVDAGLVNDAADLFTLREQRDSLLALERMGDKSVDNLLGALEVARTERSFASLLTGLGIPLLGSVAAAAIAGRYGDISSLARADPASLREELAEIHGIGPKMAESLASALEDGWLPQLAEKLEAAGVRSRAAAATGATAGGALDGKTFCVTGTLSRPRKAIHEAIRQAGGEVHDRVKKGTGYLVAGDKTGKSKLITAEKHGTQVIDEAGLDELLSWTEPGAVPAQGPPEPA